MIFAFKQTPYYNVSSM